MRRAFMCRPPTAGTGRERCRSRCRRSDASSWCLRKPPPKRPERPKALVLYARVSSHDQKSGLDGQVARLSAWAAEAGLPAVRVEAEVGSGMNGSRAKVRRLLAD